MEEQWLLVGLPRGMLVGDAEQVIVEELSGLPAREVTAT